MSDRPPDASADSDAGNLMSVWIPDDSDLVAEFDRIVCDNGRESRSEKTREAMRILIAVEDVLGTAGMDLSGRDRRMLVRQALLDEVRREE